MTSSPGELVEIEWVDSASYDAWHRDDGEEYALVFCTTVGYLTREHADRLVVVQSSNNAEQRAGVMIIPLACVRRVTVLGPQQHG